MYTASDTSDGQLQEKLKKQQKKHGSNSTQGSFFLIHPSSSKINNQKKDALKTGYLLQTHPAHIFGGLGLRKNSLG